VAAGVPRELGVADGCVVGVVDDADGDGVLLDGTGELGLFRPDVEPEPGTRLVPEPVVPVITECRGLPAAASTAVIATIARTNAARAPALTARQLGCHLAVPGTDEGEAAWACASGARSPWVSPRGGGSPAAWGDGRTRTSDCRASRTFVRVVSKECRYQLAPMVATTEPRAAPVTVPATPR
jgi:hypothetical protein